MTTSLISKKPRNKAWYAPFARTWRKAQKIEARVRAAEKKASISKIVTYRIRDANSGWYVSGNGVVVSPYFRTKKHAADFLREFKRNLSPSMQLEHIRKMA